MNGLFFGALQLAGSLVALRLTGGRHPAFATASGLLWGALVWVLVGMLLALFDLGWYRLGPTAAVVIAVAAAAALGLGVDRRALILLAAGGSLAALGGWLFTAFNVSTFSYDSEFLVLAARHIARTGGFGAELAWELRSWGVFVPMLHSAGTFLGQDYLPAAPPLLSLSGAATGGWLVLHASKSLGGDRRAGILALSVFVLPAATCWFVLWQSLYLHTNLLSGLYLLILGAAIWTAAARDRSEWNGIAAAALVAAALLRLENPLILAVAVLICVPPLRARLALALVALVTFWYGYLGLRFGTPEPGGLPSPILTEDRIGLIVAAVIAAAAVALWAAPRLARVAQIPLIVLYAGGIAALASSMLAPGQMAESLYGLLANLRPEREWQLTGLTLIALALIAAARPAPPRALLPMTLIAASLVLTWVLGLLSGPYHSAWYDSGNRRLLHVVPLLMWYLGLSFAADATQRSVKN